jgi:hypothetical protein
MTPTEKIESLNSLFELQRFVKAKFEAIANGATLTPKEMEELEDISDTVDNLNNNL